jgi:hypothetical protein
MILSIFTVILISTYALWRGLSIGDTADSKVTTIEGKNLVDPSWKFDASQGFNVGFALLDH